MKMNKIILKFKLIKAKKIVIFKLLIKKYQLMNKINQAHKKVINHFKNLKKKILKK